MSSSWPMVFETLERLWHLTLGQQEKDPDHGLWKKLGSQVWEVKVPILKKAKYQLRFFILILDTLPSENGQEKVLAKFPKPFFKIHSVTDSVIKVIFCVLQFSLSKSNLKSFYLSLKGMGVAKSPFTTVIAPGAKQRHHVFLPSPGVVL